MGAWRKGTRRGAQRGFVEVLGKMNCVKAKVGTPEWGERKKNKLRKGLWEPEVSDT